MVWAFHIIWISFVVVLVGMGGSNALHEHVLHNAQGVNFQNLHRRAAGITSHPDQGTEVPAHASTLQAPLVVAVAASEFSVQTFTQPLDHFDNTTEATFQQRFWVNTRHYRPHPGSPVIVIDGGETNGEDRLPFLDTGVGDILARATGGIAVVLEHRYYGKSVSVQNFSTDSLRWLNNEQALEDSANFMRNVKFENIDENLTARKTPWIYYGGSYAGARAAHMRVLYPDLVFGAIASSAVTHAVLMNWEYVDAIRLDAGPIFSSNLVNSISMIDSLLKIGPLRGRLKGLFGLSELESDKDSVSVLEYPLTTWEDENWDPAVSSTTFDQFCATLNGDTPTLKDTERTVLLGGGLKANIALLNYAKWIRENIVVLCPQDMGLTVEDCFGTNEDSKYQITDLSEDWRPWVFQYCTQWGYFCTAPPVGTPTIISRLLDIDYEHKICIQAFPPGEYYKVPPLPNVTAVNVLGDYHIAADRLAFIDGEVDPWRPYAPHSAYGGVEEREDTVVRPFKIIPGGVHHWDENGLREGEKEPKKIGQIHGEMVEFVNRTGKTPLTRQSYDLLDM
ncbi:serine carboxypeptidase S28-domain-containing protein [Lactifluus volemus]|nr:serine carboxypeptidase S28-domain-containing protein [Lactifluus volemus]